jgi:hypothetical protein
MRSARPESAGSAAPQRRGGGPTVGARLERDRLTDRATRLDRVISALRARAEAYETRGVPRPLSLSLADFEDELASIQARIDRGP